MSTRQTGVIEELRKDIVSTTSVRGILLIQTAGTNAGQLGAKSARPYEIGSSVVHDYEDPHYYAAGHFSCSLLRDQR